ncbi:hypothetical protein HGD90_06030 [Rhodobacteraceae bacterium R_SAG7]|nr:hypothetical protein [Rhodobacteraceae bacterium R_SAG7]
MRRIIRSAAPLGILPDQVRAMCPRDWLLIKRGYDDQSQAMKPGANAPSKSEVDELVRLYG